MRLTTPLERVAFILQFDVLCDAESYRSFCVKAFERMDGFKSDAVKTGVRSFEDGSVDFPKTWEFPGGELPVTARASSSIWQNWPYFRGGDVEFATNVFMIKNADDIALFLENRRDKDQDLSLLYSTSLKKNPEAVTLSVYLDARKIRLYVATSQLDNFRRTDKLFSVRDLPGATMILSDASHDLADLRPVGITLVTGAGQHIRIDVKKIERRVWMDRSALVCKFP